MTVVAALQKLEIVEEEMDIFVLQLALQYSGGFISTPRKPRKKPGTGGRPVLAGRVRQPIIRRHFTFANTGFYPALTENYARRKAALIGLKPMLVFTGDLRRRTVSRGTIKQIGPELALISWTNLPAYANYQRQLGRDPFRPNGSDRALLKIRGKQLIKQTVRARLLGVRNVTSRRIL